MRKEADFICVTEPSSRSEIDFVVKDFMRKKLNFGVVRKKTKRNGTLVDTYRVFREATPDRIYVSPKGLRLKISDYHNSLGDDRRIARRAVLSFVEWYEKGEKW